MLLVKQQKFISLKMLYSLKFGYSVIYFFERLTQLFFESNISSFNHIITVEISWTMFFSYMKFKLTHLYNKFFCLILLLSVSQWYSRCNHHNIFITMIAINNYYNNVIQ